MTDKLNIKILHVPDIHLYDKEIGVSQGYPEQSLDILEKIQQEFIQGDYDLVTLGGDVQHAKLTNTRYISEFQKELRYLGILAKRRLRERGLLDKIKVIDRNGEELDVSKQSSILFSVRGQHDTNSIEEFTFFDLLLQNNVLVNPLTVTIEKLQINFLNYSKDIDEITGKRNNNTQALISIFHNAIVQRGIYLDSIIGKTISPTSCEIFTGVDLALINDIHMHIPTYDVLDGEDKTIVVTPGSLGRTSFNKSHDRDFGHMVKVCIEESNDLNLKGENIYDLDVQLVEVDLVPSDKFFNKSLAFKKKRVENAFKNFCIEIEDTRINYFDVKDEIEKNVEDPEIKEICLQILESVE